jgi:DNA-binding transcriptional LysR family regulator
MDTNFRHCRLPESVAMPIDLRDLRHFLSVAAAGSISRAAQMQHMTQPALSVLIKQLEEQLGTPLFERLPKGVALTDAGERLRAHAKDILLRTELAYEEISQQARVPNGQVAVGLPQSLARFLTVPVVSDVLSRWPQIRLQVVELSSGYIPEHLQKGDIDVGMTFAQDERRDLNYTHLIDEELVFISSASQIRRHLGAAGLRRKTILLSEMGDFPMILPSRTHSLRVRLEDYLQRAGQRLTIAAEVNTTSQLIGLAASGVGTTILSYSSLVGENSAADVRALHIENPALTRSVYLCTNPSTPKTMAVMSVMRLLVDTVKRLTTEGVWPTSMERQQSGG